MSTRTGTTGIAPFVIQDDAIPQPAAYANQLNKGWHTRNTISDRNAIELHYRGWGMVCVVTNDDSSNGMYQLTRPSSATADDDVDTLLDNGNWKVFVNVGGSNVKIVTASRTVDDGTGNQVTFVPPGGWDVGDLWYVTDAAGNTMFLSQITGIEDPANSGYDNIANFSNMSSFPTDMYGGNECPMPYTYNGKQVYQFTNETDTTIVPGSWGNMGLLSGNSYQIDKLLSCDVILTTATNFLVHNSLTTFTMSKATTICHIVNGSGETITHWLIRITYTKS